MWQMDLMIVITAVIISIAVSFCKNTASRFYTRNTFFTHWTFFYIVAEHGALLRGHFLLSSGLHSDAYLQSECIMQDPANAKKVVSGLVDMLKDLDFKSPLKLILLHKQGL